MFESPEQLFSMISKHYYAFTVKQRWKIFSFDLPTLTLISAHRGAIHGLGRGVPPENKNTTLSKST